jgi:hypothetical protein
MKLHTQATPPTWVPHNRPGRGWPGPSRPKRPEKAGGMGGQSSPTTPPLPGSSRPPKGGRRGSCGGGSDPQVRPPPGDPPAAYLSTPGRPPSPRLSLRGLCGDPRGPAATPCGPAPAPGPSGAFPCAKVSFRENGGTCTFSVGGVREASSPLGPQPQMNRRGQDFYSSRSFSTPTPTSVLMSSWLIPVVSSTLSNWTFS